MSLKYVEFSSNAAPLRVQGILGYTNGYRLNRVRALSRVVDMSDASYFWVPEIRSLVSSNGKEFSAAKILAISEKRKYSLRERNLSDARYQRSIKVDADAVVYDAIRQVG